MLYKTIKMFFVLYNTIFSKNFVFQSFSKEFHFSPKHFNIDEKIPNFPDFLGKRKKNREITKMKVSRKMREIKTNIYFWRKMTFPFEGSFQNK